MYAEERRNHILKYLKKNSRVDSGELSEILDTSRETIRRDLKALAQRGLLIKTHGGAIATGNGAPIFDVPFPLRESRNIQEKQEIGALAAQFICEGDTCFMDNSSTSLYLARFLPKALKLTIVTNSLKLLFEIVRLNIGNWTVVGSGGTVSNTTFSMNNFFATNNLNTFLPTKAFFSCHGIGENLKVTDHFIDDVEIKRLVLSKSHKNILLVDHSKLNINGTLEIADITEFQCVITDKTANSDFLLRLRKEGIDVHVAPSLENQEP